jgi:predicted dehydrogenase
VGVEKKRDVRKKHSDAGILRGEKMTLRIALAGTGNIAGVHSRAIRSQPEAEPVAVVTTKSDGAVEFRQEYRIPKAYATVDDLLREEPLDALVVCTPNALHAPQAKAALRRGVAVLVEKPMGLNAAQGESMLETAQANRSVLMVAHCWRFESEVLWLKEQLRSKPLGQVIRTKSYGTHEGWGPSGWFTDPALAGGGALADMGIHAIDTTRFLLGDPLPASVYARIGTYYSGSGVDDTGILIVNFDIWL